MAPASRGGSGGPVGLGAGRGIESSFLWTDDLVYAAIIKNSDLLESLSVPIHVAPGLFLIWRWLYASIPDLELALQALPFVCALAAIPVVAVVVRKLTNDDALAACAAAVTALTASWRGTPHSCISTLSSFWRSRSCSG